MLEIILLVNLAFSICGFFFIVRMWKEVKARRDFYGENFGLPMGKAKEQEPLPPVRYREPGLSDEQIARVVAAMREKEPEPEPEPEYSISEGDLQRVMAAIAKSGGGA